MIIFWRAVKIWPNSTVYIIGGGPSLKDFDLSLLKKKRTIGVNNAYKLADWIDVCWFGDSTWYDDHHEALDEWPGLKIHCCNRHENRPGTKRLLRGQPLGIDPRPTHVAWNNNSGSSAINLAVHLGAKRIILLGFDMKFGEYGQNNWHNDHPKPRDPKNWDPYPKFLQPFPIIKQDAEKMGITILNATPGSALDIFPMVKIEDVL